MVMTDAARHRLWAEQLASCRLCPRRCGIDRRRGAVGYCRAGAAPRVARAALHHWEEPPISGTRGSGAVFFSHCNLRCVFCQNAQISQGDAVGIEVSITRLAAIFLELQAQGAHNVNLVSPTHYLPQVGAALERAREQGLVIPAVWNSNGYESPEALASLEGLVDIYLPDFKYVDAALAVRLSDAPGYFAAAQGAVAEMLRQVGPPSFDAEGIARHGLIVRHLVLPGQIEDSAAVLAWIAGHLPHSLWVSLMSQYAPAHRAASEAGWQDLARRLTEEEYDAVIAHFFAVGLENGYSQELDSADRGYTPPFDLSGVEAERRKE